MTKNFNNFKLGLLILPLSGNHSIIGFTWLTNHKVLSYSAFNDENEEYI